ncbi:MAG: hypothetical protein WD942_08320 [Dehalococcoidia bacterium]
MIGNWVEHIAERAGVDGRDAEIMLRRRGISADRPLRPARALCVNRIAFRGEKRGAESGRFNFDWSSLGAGVWAAASYDNLVGKSTVLEILLWCFRGEPKGLQDDIRRWLEAVEVQFAIDDQRYVIAFQLVEGSPVGTVSRLRPDGSADAVDEFSSDAGFAAAMSSFMMGALELDPVPARQKIGDDEQTVGHGWTALSGALYFGGDHKLLLGDVQWGGLPARMLQMYIGLPWARTVMQASTAQKEVEHEITQASRANAEAKARADAVRQRLQAELDQARRKLNGASRETVTAEHLQEMTAEVARLSSTLTELERRLATAEDEYTVLQRVADEDERALRDVRENVIADRFFNGLTPTCCPRCETAVTRQRVQRESADLSCSLCSEPIDPERAEDVSEVITSAEERHEVTRSSASRAKAALAPLKQERDRIQLRLDTAMESLTAAAGGEAFRRRREAELETARLEGALRERGREEVQFELPTDAAVVQAAHSEAKAAFDSARGDLLDRLNEEILRLGNAFGVHGLEMVNLNSNAQMRLQKGGESTSFSKLTAGERLRLRIATAIALLRVGRERGVGRHPGLLIIDSPGAEETSESDLTTLLKELQHVASETEGLQILVASADAPAVIAALGTDKCRIAPPGEKLW